MKKQPLKTTKKTTAMATKETPESKVKDAVDDNAVQPTVSPDPKASEDNGLKTVNIPVSASNALSPEAGIQVPTTADTKEVIQTDAYDPQKTRLQNVLTGDDKESNTVTKAKYDAVVATLNEVLSNHTLDAVHVDMYKAKAGIK